MPAHAGANEGLRGVRVPLAPGRGTTCRPAGSTRRPPRPGRERRRGDDGLGVRAAPRCRRTRARPRPDRGGGQEASGDRRRGDPRGARRPRERAHPPRAPEAAHTSPASAGTGPSRTPEAAVSREIDFVVLDGALEMHVFPRCGRPYTHRCSREGRARHRGGAAGGDDRGGPPPARAPAHPGRGGAGVHEGARLRGDAPSPNPPGLAGDVRGRDGRVPGARARRSGCGVSAHRGYVLLVDDDPAAARSAPRAVVRSPHVRRRGAGPRRAPCRRRGVRLRHAGSNGGVAAARGRAPIPTTGRVLVSGGDVPCVEGLLDAGVVLAFVAKRRAVVELASVIEAILSRRR